MNTSVMDNTTQLPISLKSAIPSIAKNVTFNEAANMFLTNGYVSAAGNVYQEGLRISNYIALNYSIGHGYAHSFLNGVRLFVWDGNKPKLVASRSFSCYFLSEAAMRDEAVTLLEQHIVNSCNLIGARVPAQGELRQLAGSLVDDTMKNKLLR